MFNTAIIKFGLFVFHVETFGEVRQGGVKKISEIKEFDIEETKLFHFLIITNNITLKKIDKMRDKIFHIKAKPVEGPYKMLKIIFSCIFLISAFFRY